MPDYEDLKAYTFNSKPNTDPYLMNVGFNYYLDNFENDHFKLQTSGRKFKEYIENKDLEIICEGKAEQKTAGRLADVEKNLKSYGKSVRLRQDVSELLSSDLKKAKPAKFSFTSDNEKNEDITAIDGAIGYVFSGSLPPPAEAASIGYNLIPFLYYKSTSGTAGGRGDIDVFAPGILGGMEYGDAAWAFKLDIAAAPVLDAKQKSELYNFTARLAPTFSIGDTSIFGEEHNFGLLGVTFVARAVAKMNYIQESGLNPNFSDIEEFSTTGFEGRIIIAGRDGTPILENFVFIVEYSNLHNSDGVQDVERTSMTLSYSPTEAKNFTIDFGYVEGPDPFTLQLEEKWTASLGLRF